MGAAEQLSRGRSVVTGRLDVLLVAVFGAVLFVDLVRQFVGGGISFPFLASVVLEGLVIGLAYGLAGIGLSMTYSILNFANFAHGDTITVGAFAGWSVAYVVGGLGTAGVGSLFLLTADPGISIANAFGVVVVGALAAGLGAVVLSLALDRIVYKPMRDAGGISLLIASIGVALALRYLIAFVYGTGVKGITAPVPKVAFLTVNGVSGFGVIGPDQQVGQLASVSELSLFVDLPFGAAGSEVLVSLTLHGLALALTAAGLMLAMHFFLQRSKLGKAMRAMADNKPLARVTGIPTERVIRMTWVLGGALTGIAGFLIVLESGTMSFSFGWLLLLFVFAAVILGGIGSIYGAMAGGVIVGLVDSMAIIWLPSGLTKAAAFVVLIVVLLLRPEGLFGGVTTA
jgi:branched-chain amino acid transport system permease protein